MKSSCIEVSYHLELYSRFYPHLENLCHTRPLVGLVLEQLLDEVLGERPDPAGHVVLVLLDAVVRVLQGLGLEAEVENYGLFRKV